MTRTVLSAIIFALVLAAPAAWAQQNPPANDGRFSFHRVEDGYLRLDGRTGQVSLCAQRPEGWACEVVADDGRLTEAQIEPPRRPRREPELKRVMAFIETVWRRVVALVADAHKDFLRKT
jgi:hypothetical protein